MTQWERSSVVPPTRTYRVVKGKEKSPLVPTLQSLQRPAYPSLPALLSVEEVSENLP